MQGVRTFIEEELKALGCHILCTGDGTHAIRQLRFAAANKTPYNLLLLDYHVRRVSCRVRVSCVASRVVRVVSCRAIRPES